MNAQRKLLEAGGSILALAGAMAKIKSKLNKRASDNAKKSYEKAVNTKKENKGLTKNNIEQVVKKKTPQPFGEFAHNEEEIPTEPVKAKTELEKATVENKKQVKGFDGLTEEAAKEAPITAENTETKIPVDEDVKGLIEVKQKNLKRAAAASNARKAYIESKGYEADYPIRDYLPDVSDAELYKAGITKTDLNKLSSILAGNGTEDDFQGWFKDHGAEDIPESGVINFGSLRVQEEAANAIKTYIIDKNKYDVNAQEEYDLSKADSEEENYKVWQDEIQDDTQETDRSFKGIVF